MRFQSIRKIVPERAPGPAPEADLCLLPLVLEAGALEPDQQAWLGRSAGLVQSVLERPDFTGEAGQTLLVHTGESGRPRILLVGTGPAEAWTRETVRRVAAAALRKAQELKTERAVLRFPLPGCPFPPSEQAALIAEGAVLGTHRYIPERLEGREQYLPLQELILAGSADWPAREVEDGVRAGLVLASGVCLARDLAQTPANLMTPSILAAEADGIARRGGLVLTVMDEEDCRREGMNAFLGVAAGSSQPPRFIQLEYDCGRSGAPRVGLVGKGVTFDSGGISIKPRLDMHLMKLDMAGAAAVLGVLSCLRDLEVPVHVTAAIPATENLPGGRAVKPGDVVRSLSGRTIEILNTDAEGRLILADALTWVARKARPDALVDLATLTSAVHIALGRYGAGVMSNDDALAGRIEAASERSGERMWRLPLWEELPEHLRSDSADLRNIGDAVSGAGALMAGSFLSHFTEDVPWAHIDIAGAAWSDRDRPLHVKGPSGYGVRLVMELLRGYGEESIQD